MNYLIKKLVVAAAVFALLGPSIQARPQQGGLRGGVDDPPGLGAGPPDRPRPPQGFRPAAGDGPEGGAGSGGAGRGPHPGDFFGRNETLFVNLTCDKDSAGVQAYPCDLPRGDEQGMFVCRSTRFHPDTEEMNQFPMCIPPDRAMQGDVCGCCGQDDSACPKPCGCTCELGAGRDGVMREGAYVIFDEDAEDKPAPVCVPIGVSMRLVARSTEDRAVTCFEECR